MFYPSINLFRRYFYPKRLTSEKTGSVSPWTSCGKGARSGGQLWHQSTGCHHLVSKNFFFLTGNLILQGQVWIHMPELSHGHKGILQKLSLITRFPKWHYCHKARAYPFQLLQVIDVNCHILTGIWNRNWELGELSGTLDNGSEGWPGLAIKHCGC